MTPTHTPTAVPFRRRAVRWLAALCIAGLGGALVSSAGAVSPADVMELRSCLELQDTDCALAAVKRASMDTSDDPLALASAALAWFSAGDYPRAYDTLARAVERGWQDEYADLALYERTMYATAGWVEVPSGRFRIRYRPGLDALLVDDIGAVLEATDRNVTPLIGGVPPGRTIVELFPDGHSFVAASSLTFDDVQSTGVVALSKWTRLLVTSPRALGRGYDWKSTASHEYIHLVVAHASANNAPVWLQEGIAKYLDGRWERPGFQLDSEMQGWLAEGIARKDLVPFSEMHPSLAKIKVYNPDGSVDGRASAERAGLAYAQLATLVQFAMERGGPDTLKRTLAQVRGGNDPQIAFALAAGFQDFASLTTAWDAWIRTQPLISRRIEAMPTVLDGGDDAAQDPVMSGRRDLANKLRLGDLLAAERRWDAALIEYAAARDPERPTAPLLASRMAPALAAAGRVSEAEAMLRASLADYPDFAPGWRALGQILFDRGAVRESLDPLRQAVDLDPFDDATQRRLRDVLARVGDAPALARQDALLHILDRGGADVEPPPLHQRSGSYELPRTEGADDGAPEGARTSLEQKPAPDFEVTTLAGAPLRLRSLRGKVVMLDFWATWCGPCVASMPKLSELVARERARGLEVVGISDEPPTTVSRFVMAKARGGLTLQQTLATEDGSVRQAYGVSSIPMLVVVDRSGVVRDVHVGAQGLDEVFALVEQLLAEAPPTGAE